MQDHGVGDAITLTSILYNWSKKNKVSVISLNPEIYQGLNIKNIGLKRTNFTKELISFLGNSNHSNIVGYSNGNLLYKSSQFYAKGKKEFLRELLLEGRPDIKERINGLEKENKIFFNESEKEEFEEKFSNILKEEYALIITGTKENSTKIWPTKNFQKVVEKTAGKIRWCQVGTSRTEELKGVLDLRGKTTLREVFFLSSRAKFILCSEGMFTHLSSAFNTPCVTIYSGFHYPEISFYKNVIPISSKPLPKCAYCWKSKCNLYDFPICIENIKIQDVLSKIKEIL